MKKHKQDDKRRTRNLSAGIKLTEAEQNEFKRICEELGTTKLNFLLQAMENYKALAK